MLNLKKAAKKESNRKSAVVVDPSLLGQYHGPKPTTNGFKSGVKTNRTRVFEFEHAGSSSDVEIQRKKGLMNIESHRVYNQLGFAVKSHEIARQALIWMNNLREATIDEDDHRVVDILTKRLADLVQELFYLKKAKIEQSADMETALNKASRDIQRARVAAFNTGKEARLQNSFTPEPDHPETAEPSVPVDPALILQKAEQEIRRKEKKGRRKKSTSYPEAGEEI